jgi:hypothetical protein
MPMPTDGRPVATRITASLPRAFVALAAGLLATATIGYASEVRVKPQRHHAIAAKRHRMIVPDVRNQVFVFAKGMLEDDGFAWAVAGGVHGFAPNRVISQTPAPGTRIFDTGSPTITLELERTSGYAENGAPEDRSPYAATKIVVFHPELPKAKTPARPKKARATGSGPAFVVPGAPSQPAGTSSLPTLAHNLASWINHHPHASSAHTRHWLSAHAWITTGARFGWSGGAESLTILIRADKRAEHLWKVGSQNRKLAEETLRFVHAQSR